MYNILSRLRDGHARPQILSEPIGCKYLIEFHKDVWRYIVECDSTNDAIDVLSKYANDDEEIFINGSLEAGDFTFDYGEPVYDSEEEE